MIKWRDNVANLAMLEHLDAVFARHQTKQGLVCLDQAAASGHKADAYVLGMLLYTLEDNGDLAKLHIVLLKIYIVTKKSLLIVCCPQFQGLVKEPLRLFNPPCLAYASIIEF
jgi:hypothetical protein